MIARVSAFTKYSGNQSEMHPPAQELGAEPIAPGIDLPQGASLSRTALVLPSDLSIDDWATLGAKIGTFDEAFRWHLGDWWHYGAHSYGARKAKVQAKGAFPFSFATLMNLGWVAGKVQSSLRRETLSWSHHVLIAHEPPDLQDKWLKKAVRLKWPVAKLRQKMYEAAMARTAEQTIYDHALNYCARLEQHITGTYEMIVFSGVEAELLSHLHAYQLRELADKCDEAAKWWADTGEIIRTLSDANAEWEERENAKWKAEQTTQDDEQGAEDPQHHFQTATL
jgi:hypothetical protein